MKKIAILLMILLNTGLANATRLDSVNVDDRSLKVNYMEITQYQLYDTKELVPLYFDFGAAKIKNPEDYPIKKGKQVKQVDLVFSKYPKDLESWEFEKLIQRRMSALRTIDTVLFNQPTISWNVVLQTNCNSEKEAKALFHGFVVKYTLGYDFIDRSTFTYDFESEVTGIKGFADSTVIKVLERHPEWQDMLVVTDFTGSMYPYASQVALWNRLNTETKPIKHYVFFNDGDKTPDVAKIVGMTGGIYHTPSGDHSKVIDEMIKTMKGGFGGDGPENDMEALLFGIRKAKTKVKQIVLVADNNSWVRDIDLLKKINVPVKVILCGTHFGYINAQYFEIAYKTGGSVHTIETDIEDMKKALNGKAIEIGGLKYKIKDGAFIMVTDA